LLDVELSLQGFTIPLLLFSRELSDIDFINLFLELSFGGVIGEHYLFKERRTVKYNLFVILNLFCFGKLLAENFIRFAFCWLILSLLFPVDRGDYLFGYLYVKLLKLLHLPLIVPFFNIV
jgi:hypothetical protein